MLDFLSEDMRRNPYPVYDQVRALSPVLLEPRTKLWMIFDYEGVKRAFTDQEAFSSDLANVAKHPTPAWLIFTDGEKHAKLRAIIKKAFTPRMVAGLEPRIRKLSRDLIDNHIERGEMDLAADLTIPLPMMVIAQMIGIPAGDWARFQRWSDAILNISYTIRGINTGGEQAIAAHKDFIAACDEMRAYLPAVIEERLRDPKDDLLTGIATAEVDGQKLSFEEMLGFLQLLVVGGQETTTNLINNAILSLLENPDQLALLRRRMDLLPSAIEETLRYRSPFQWVFRATRHDVEMHGQTIPAGKLLLTMIGSANRDPNQFADPHRFDITRDPNSHLAFGHGSHFCLGAPLSRLEARVVLCDVLDRLKGLELATSEPWEPRKPLHVHGPERLPVRFAPGSQTSSPS